MKILYDHKRKKERETKVKYNKELHDKLRNRTGLHIFNHQIGLDSEDIDALLEVRKEDE